MGHVQSFFKKTEEFIKKRQKEATTSKAATVFMIGTILTYIILELIGFGNLGFSIRMGQTPDLASIVLEIIRGIIQVALCISLPYMFILWHIGRSKMKLKATFSEIAYVFMLTMMVSNALLILVLLSSIFLPSIACLFLPLFVVSAYLPITTIKVIYKTDYVKAVLVLIGTNIIMSFVTLILMSFFTALVPSVISTNLFWTQKNITENENGTIGISFENNYGESCSFIFPEGWRIADDKVIKELGYSSIKNQLIYKEDGSEYWLFSSIIPKRVFPAEMDERYYLEVEKKEEQDITSNKIIEKIDHRFEYLSTNKSVEIVEVSTKILDKNLIIHQIEIMYPNFIGYEAKYASIYENDGDYYSIINNSDCVDTSPIKPKETNNNTDGSTIIEYEGELNGEKAVCTITIPPGWRFPSMKDPYLLGRTFVNRVYYGQIAYKEASWNTSQKTYLYFDFEPPISVYKRITCQESNETMKLGDRNLMVIGTTHMHIETNKAEVCDTHLSDEARTESHHEIIYQTADGLGYKMIFESPYEEDNDLDYIIENTQCRWK